MTTITVELLTCPFCGGDAETDTHSADCYFTVYADMLAKAERNADLSGVPAVLKAWNRRALLAEQPQAGAGQAAPGVTVLIDRDKLQGLLWYADRLLEDVNIGARFAGSVAPDAVHSDADYLAATELLAAPQPAARQEQGDEVRRLREALMAIQSSTLRFIERGVAPGRITVNHWHETAESALTTNQERKG